ncbi:hypothetical protein [Geitlerinema calcuttense]|uniref:Uncharacterized protein n=1 Tax=Geitlerinema calcuttense NRMC-F 0142 TaxID=2922238 RepID=A0ABT7LYI5_9CYAN|nr:hypothetical protein [Geitlerinema calcuttense]MDL5057058.1 hypothetical protein [Geitlerinema calcuttense NRMC-F 0142]
MMRIGIAKRRFRRMRRLRSPFYKLLAIAAVIVCFVYWVAVIACARPVHQGDREIYYAAGDEFLTAGFYGLEDYWNNIAKTQTYLVRGHLDNYLPIALKSLNYKPADATMRLLAEAFFAPRHPQTGLIPFSYNTRPYSNLPNSYSPQLRHFQTEGKQPVALIGRAIDFCQWFPNDLTLQNRCVALAKATLQYFDFRTPSGERGGMWGWVNVANGGEPRGAITLIQDYGEVAKGLAYLSARTGDPQFLQWADQKLQFVWQNRMNPNLPLLPELLIPSQALNRPEEPSSDTDTLYYVRQLFDLYQMTGNTRYRDWAMAVTRLWFEQAWNPQWGHFVRKLTPLGTPAVSELYGDGKYNTLHILVRAYQVTQDEQYLQRLKVAWSNLVKMGSEGLVPERIDRGIGDRAGGLDRQQTIFLSILVDAYRVSGDRVFLQEAESLGRRILQRGKAVMRAEGGQAGEAFLQLAIARQKIGRLEVAIARRGTQLRIERGNQQILEVSVPSEVAVIYLPEGTYQVTANNHGSIQKKVLHLEGQMHF